MGAGVGVLGGRWKGVGRVWGCGGGGCGGCGGVGRALGGLWRVVRVGPGLGPAWEFYL